MPKIFNVTADCKPQMHYMVDITETLIAIKKMINAGHYFTINRPRQYGKTTILRRLVDFLKEDYIVVNLDFQNLSQAKFKNENVFSLAFAKLFLRKFKNNNLPNIDDLHLIISKLNEETKEANSNFELFELFDYLSEICAVSDKPIVLMIDEVDSATNNQIFLDFLAQLRSNYIDRDISPTFQSVILAGVYDVKNLKRKIRPDEEQKVNSPWNIATDFTLDMSFSKNQIQTMLKEYEEDYHTGMDIEKISELLYDYTSGYPFLVSRLCKLMDEFVFGTEGFDTKKKVWAKAGFLKAVKLILEEKNTLFESLFGKLTNYPEMNNTIKELLFTGKSIAYNADNLAVDTAAMFGFIKNKDGLMAIANRIFEVRLYNFYLSTNETYNEDIYKASLLDKNQFVINGHLNLKLVLEKFVKHFNELYGGYPTNFLEEEGRKYFLLYLRPIINGVGNYYVEARTRDMKRTDVVVDYCGEQFVIESKIWHGEEYNSRGEKQLVDYLNYYQQNKGYMISFNFNKNKKIGVKEIELGDKLLIEAVV